MKSKKEENSDDDEDTESEYEFEDEDDDDESKMIEMFEKTDRQCESSVFDDNLIINET
jgi:hypothetical protein